MWQVFDPDDEVLKQEFFLADEVPYNLIHHIIDSPEAMLLKTEDHRAIFAQSPGHNAWLWISPIPAIQARRLLIQELVHHLYRNQHPVLCGITGDPAVAELFAASYQDVNKIYSRFHASIESHSCTKVRSLSHIAGEMIKPAFEHIDVIAQYMCEFADEEFGVEIAAKDYVHAAARAVGSGNTYLWIVDGQPVATASIAHRSPRHARINGVYTPPHHRHQGYAEAIIAAICGVLHQEGRRAMLYTDQTQVSSNQTYGNVGFAIKGKVIDIRFRDVLDPPLISK